MPLLDTPGKLQRSDHDCGATAFEILFRYHYPRRPLPDWGELADPVRGLGPDAMELFVRKEFPNVCVGHLGLKELKFFTGFTPVLCVVTVGAGADHWVVCRGVTNHRVHVQCPSLGRLSHSHAEWLAVWKDATAGGAYSRFAVAGWVG